MPWITRRTFSMLLLLLLCMVAMATVSWLFPVTAIKGYFSSSYVQREAALTSPVTAEHQDHVEHGQQQNATGAQQQAVPGTSIQEELKARRQTVDQLCASTKHFSARLQGVFVNEAHKLAYCFVPKTGCTFWKRVFGFLNNNTGLPTPVRSPFDIPRLLIHLNRHANGVPWSKCQKTVSDPKYLRFMFSRDPYSRLWSAYLDKFYLPDFWAMLGDKILASQRQLSSKERACGSNVTFPQFIQYTLRAGEPHWNPVAHTCDPCQFKPEVIGKMETYSRDARVILDHAGLGWIMDDMDHDKQVRSELEMLVEYNFDVIHKKSPQLFLNKCIDDESLGLRLWKTFQFNGYISDKVVYRPPSPFTRESFKQLVLKAMEESAQYGKSALKEQKKKALESAFKQLSQDTLRRIASKYDIDFKMFGYSARTFR